MVEHHRDWQGLATAGSVTTPGMMREGRNYWTYLSLNAMPVGEEYCDLGQRTHPLSETHPGRERARE